MAIIVVCVGVIDLSEQSVQEMIRRLKRPQVLISPEILARDS